MGDAGATGGGCVVIPAAGLGIRFLPLTRVVPKELLPFGDWPLIHHALLEAERAGFGEAIVVISPRKRSIRRYFDGDGALERSLRERGLAGVAARVSAAADLAARLRLRFIEKDTNGPGEAVLAAHHSCGDDGFGVLLPDDVVPAAAPWPELFALHRRTGAPVLSVRSFAPEEAGRYGVAVCTPDNHGLRVRRLVEKPARGAVVSPYRVFGRYIVTGSIIAALAARLGRTGGELQLTDAYADCLDHDPGVLAAEFDGETFDCGTPGEYMQSVARHAMRTAVRDLAAAGARP